jgi:hypothetical protein
MQRRGSEVRAATETDSPKALSFRWISSLSHSGLLLRLRSVRSIGVNLLVNELKHAHSDLAKVMGLPNGRVLDKINARGAR